MSNTYKLLIVAGLVTILAGCVPSQDPSDVVVQNSSLSDTTNDTPFFLNIGLPMGLQIALKDLENRFGAENPQVKLKFHEGELDSLVQGLCSGKLLLDIILAQGELEIKPLLDAGLIKGQGIPVFSRSMELIVASGNPLGLKSLADLAREEVQEVVVAIPETSLGQASEKALSKAGVLEKLTQAGKLRRVTQPLEAKRRVTDGEADAALVYRAARRPAGGTADPKRSAEGKVDVVMTVPEADAGQLVVVAATLKAAPSPELSEKFIGFLRTPSMQEALALRGYGKVQ